MKREIELHIKKRLDKSNKALLVSGPGKVGKTYSIKRVLEENCVSYFEINLLERPEILSSLKNSNNINNFVDKFKLFSPTKLKEGKSVIFLDEIQVFPELMTKIKFLVDEGSFKYILSGSLLGVELQGIKSVPVGYMEELKMYPMNFLEFCDALGIQQTKINHIKECFNNRKHVDDVIHQEFITAFYYYLISGGMPNVVSNFIKNKNLVEVSDTQKSLLEFYKKDFTQYEQIDKRLKIISIYENIPSQLNKQNNKFVFTLLNKQLKFDRYENSFLWLKDAGVALPVYIVADLRIPLISSKEKNTFKLFMSDVGLLTSTYPSETQLKILEMNKENEINNGALFENFVAQELVSNGLTPYYFKTKNIGEVDFLVEVNGEILPIEVKSGSDYKKHNALDNLIRTNKKQLAKPVVLSLNNVEVEDEIDYIPIYMCSFIKNDKPKNIKIDFDIFK